MIYALLALNYQKDNSIIMKAYQGLKSYICKTDSHYHLQNSPSTIWDTALLSYAVQEAGVAIDDPFVSSSISYIRSKQQTKKGDWAIHAKDVDPGGWGFSDSNSFIPDNDDTSAALRAITRAAIENPHIQENWNIGVNYLIGLQNKDGGWGAFEKDVTSKWLTQLPIENAEDAITDPSTPDLTGRVLEFFGNYSNISNKNDMVLNAVNWLLDNQEVNGSWYGRWGICYLYGTWAAVTGLRAVGVAKDHPSIKKAEKWLLSIQNVDGGWGESCLSAVKKKFVPLKFSTPSQTAWAIDTLLTIRDRNDDAIQKGVNYLLNQTSRKENELKYPTGLGLPGQFYVHYHSYNHIFPLLALSHYVNSREKD
jgi:sporulenol synthase